LRTTPLTEWHREHGGRMVPFAGYEMPVQYGTGVLAEHEAVRERVGLFDITHMGEIEITGPDAGRWLDGLVTNRVHVNPVGKVVYTAMCRPDGGVLDDMLIYHLEPERWLVVCNAVNRDKIVAWLQERLPEAGATLVDRSDETALIAVQGPASPSLLERAASLADSYAAISRLDFYTGLVVHSGADEWVVSRTGYTGERGYEIYVPGAAALGLWRELLAAGADLGAIPVGLAARDTLRFEMGYCLYGHELDEQTTPLEAGIGWAVRTKDRQFVGRDALVRQRQSGVPRRLLGLEVEGRAIARQATPVFAGGRQVGSVTSGNFSPTLRRSLALALVTAGLVEPGGGTAGSPGDGSTVAELAVEIRGRTIPCRQREVPFVEPRVKGEPQAARNLSEPREPRGGRR
jgi:aminomethyltransferase